MTFVLAVDPGGTSGWAEALVRDGNATTLRQTLSHGEHDPSAMADRIRQFCLSARQMTYREPNDVVLVMERFTITVETGRKTAQHDALELIGLGRYLAEWSGVTFDVSQAPGDAKSFAPNDRLREWGVWVPRLDHARDAVRHLCLYAAKQRVFLG